MEKIVTVIGARPQFIKAAPVSKEIAKDAKLQEIIVHTGQHYDSGMSKIFFNELEIPEPDYNLDVGSASHAVQTGKIMKRLEEVLIKEKPDLLLIYGDTNSTLAGALTASKLHIPIAHVEAGLRSFNMKMPEEINRVVADRLSTILFAPTKAAVQNLKNEGITEGVYKTGDVMYDVALQYKEKANNISTILNHLGLSLNEYILATIHRAENTDNRERLTNIFTALNQTALEKPVVLPLHPRAKKMLDTFGLTELLKGLIIIEPVGFLDMICLESNAILIITDSGGIQKEAYFHRVPCITLRDETEWVETVEARWNTLADVISIESITHRINEQESLSDNRKNIDEYGDGRTSDTIISRINQFFL